MSQQEPRAITPSNAYHVHVLHKNHFFLKLKLGRFMTGRVIKQERAIRTRAALITGAAHEFAKSGFAGATVSKIARNAEVTLGALYFHFPDGKHELARAIVRGQPDTVTPPLPATGLQRAIDITLTWAWMMLDNPVVLAGARLVADQDQFLEMRDNSHAQWTEVISAAFDAAKAQSDVREEVDLQAMARLIVNAATGAQLHANMESQMRDLPNRMEETWRCLLPALARPEVIARLSFAEERGRPASAPGGKSHHPHQSSPGESGATDGLA
ncbi:ScbR family autoregulator-binding transcription factor [Streptomyces sp. NPDC059740]|uniref:ScbR family autoregulator-binding transcription factor n=1 Tax=Streptomyces sp. NPDC059740 TaxID=3346926 RepID=UPI00364B391B